MSDTPETDGELNRIACYEHPQFEQGIAGFARKLERERDDLRRELNDTIRSCYIWQDGHSKIVKERNEYYNELLTKRGLCKVQAQVIDDWKSEAEKWRAIADDNRN